MMVAEAMTDVNYITVIVQLGSFGLVVAAAVWGSRWLPRRLKEQDDAYAAERREEREVRKAEAAHVQAMITVLVTTFKEDMKTEREVCAHQFGILNERLEKSQELLARTSATLDRALVSLREYHDEGLEVLRDTHAILVQAVPGARPPRRRRPAEPQSPTGEDSTP